MRIGLLPFLFIVFLILKTTHTVDWSWPTVFIPLFIMAGLFMFAVFLGVVEAICD